MKQIWIHQTDCGDRWEEKICYSESQHKDFLETSDGFISYIESEAFIKLKAALRKAEIYMSCQAHSYWQMVRQLDGSVKNEMIPTQCKIIYDELKELLNELNYRDLTQPRKQE